jgi:hypothetical protein
LESYLSAGGNLLIFPRSETGNVILQPFTQRLNISQVGSWEEGEFRVGSINLEDPIFAGVFEEIREDLNLPQTKGLYALPTSGANPGLSLLDYRDNRPYVAKYRHGPGAVFLSSSRSKKSGTTWCPTGKFLCLSCTAQQLLRANWTNPLMCWAAISAFPCATSVPTASPNSELRATESSYRVLKETGSSLYLNVYDQVREPGFYEIRQDEELHKIAAFNFDRRESEVEAYSAGELEELAEGYARLYPGERVPPMGCCSARPDWAMNCGNGASPSCCWLFYSSNSSSGFGKWWTQERGAAV